MRKAILCVDDEAIIALALKHELKQHFKDRFIYESALSAEEALEIIDELSADGIILILVLSDWLMPGMRGDEFLQRVKAKHPNVKALLITGQAPEDITQALVSSGIVEEVIHKPWSGEHLLKVVNACIDCEGDPDPILQEA